MVAALAETSSHGSAAIVSNLPRPLRNKLLEEAAPPSVLVQSHPSTEHEEKRLSRSAVKLCKLPESRRNHRKATFSGFCLWSNILRVYLVVEVLHTQHSAGSSVCFRRLLPPHPAELMYIHRLHVLMLASFTKTCLHSEPCLMLLRRLRLWSGRMLRTSGFHYLLL